MCNPMLFMAGVSAAGSVLGGMSARKQSQNDAAWQEYSADQEEIAAMEEAGRVRKLGRSQVSKARSQLAASGVDVNAGTAGLIQDEITTDAESDAFAALLTGRRRAQQLRAGAASTRAGGQQAMNASMIQAGGTALSAWYGMNKSGWRTRG